MGRKTWDQLTDEQKAAYDWVDLVEGETMADWWEIYMDAVEEDGSWEDWGWLCDTPESMLEDSSRYLED